MRIQEFWAEGFRSLLDVHLKDLGPFNVFYGENGAGKSNVLAGLELLVKVASLAIAEEHDIIEPSRPKWLADLVRDDDFCHFAAKPKIRLGMTLARTGDGPLFSSSGFGTREIMVEITLERLPSLGICVYVSRLEAMRGDLLFLWSSRRSLRTYAVPALSPRDHHEADEFRSDLIRWFETVFADASYRLVPAVRAMTRESGAFHADYRPSITELLHRGRIKEAFVLALTSPDPVIRDRFARLRELLSGEPLHRPPFDPVYDPLTQHFEIRERPKASGSRDVPLDLAGLGIQQIYAVLGQILLGHASAVGIEEPEAHLHAPTSGRHLRTLLRRLVERGDVQQLFISTHSNLFDLDPTGYYDVRREDGVTIVERKAGLSEIDRKHLYEPGPAKHGLEDLLLLVDPSTPVLRRPDGSSVSAGEMLVMLQEDAPEAVDFLRDVHGAAVRAVQLRTARKQ